ncbi:MAG: ribonuclease HII [Pseudomonadota bacterium]|nr:ribonuclease HII [Pseudomonadota bacterium]
MWIAGVDEVGRGPLAGPVIAAAVILTPEADTSGLTDSKKLSASRRESLCHRIQQQALAWSIGRAEADEIDRLNIHQATLLAMRRAVAGLAHAPTEVWVDGIHAPDVNCLARAFVGGDGLHAPISAASIVAKVHRDREMTAMAEEFPQYGFERHKGYPTAVHLAALESHGVCPIHRLSFAPVRRVVESMTAP